MNKKLISVFITTLLLIQMSVMPAYAQESQSSGIFYYIIMDNEAVITHCDSLASGIVEVPSILGGYPVTTINSNVFEGCYDITEIQIPQTVTSILTTFAECQGLGSIQVNPQNPSYQSIQGILFDKNAAVLLRYPPAKADMSYTLPDGVISIAPFAFSGCTDLATVLMCQGITDIGEYAFQNCFALSDIMMPDSITFVGTYAFDHTPWYESQGDFILAGRVLVKYKGTDGVIAIPDHVRSIGTLAFSDCIQITAIDIPNGVTTIYEYAFFNCTNLTNITLPESVNALYDGVFTNCRALNRMQIPQGITMISNMLFLNCTALTEVILPSGLTGIGQYAFCSCTTLTNLQLPEGITVIGAYAFSDCNALSSLGMPGSITDIHNNAFAYCTSLASISLPETLYSIGSGAFSFCSTLSEITIPNSIKTIESTTFAYSGLKRVTLPEGIISIEDFAFTGCPIVNLVIPEGVSSIGRFSFEFCYALTTVIMPNSVTDIGDYAFGYCPELKSVVLSDGLTSIGNQPFIGSKQVTLYVKAGTYAQNYAVIKGISSREKERVMLLLAPSNQDGLPITMQSLYDASSLQLQIYAEKDAENALLLFAFYKKEAHGDRLLSLVRYDGSLKSGQITIPVSTPNNADKLKILCWDGLESAKPLMQYFVLK